MLLRSRLAALAGAAFLSAGCDQSSTGPERGSAPVVTRESAVTIEVVPPDRISTQVIDPSADSIAAQPELPRSVPGELLVKFKTDVADSDIALKLEQTALRSVTTVGQEPQLRRVTLADPADAEQALAEYQTDPAVEYAEPNYIIKVRATPDDPSFGSQWSLHNVGQTGGAIDADVDAPEAWNVTTGNANVVVAVIDTGVDFMHPDLAANMHRNTADCDTDSLDDDGNGFADDCYGIDARDSDSNPQDDNGHGTHVAGILGAVGNNALGIAGTAWNVKILPCKFADASGEGTAADAIECLDYVAAMKDRGINIVATNNSWGIGNRSQALADAIQRQFQRGILFVAAAGNDYVNIADSYLHEDGSVFPCGNFLPNVICVGNSKNDDDYGLASNFSRQVVHVFAPGESIYSTLPGGAYGTRSGSSMAAPHVSGIIALLNSVANPGDWRATRNRILTGSDESALLLSRLDEFRAVTGRRANANGAFNCNNRTVTGRVSPPSLGPRLDDQRVGVPIRLAVLNINCANPNGAVSVSVQPGNVTIPLTDDGIGADIAAGDGIYSATWTPAASGSYALSFPGTAPDDSDQLVSDVLTVNVDALLKPGFPVRTLHSGGSFNGRHEIVVADVSAAPGLEVFTTGWVSGPVYGWNAVGAPLTNFPRRITDTTRFDGAANLSAGRFLSGSGQMQVVAGYNEAARIDLSGFVLGSIDVFQDEAVSVPGWPRNVLRQVVQTASVADIDGDGKDELFAGDYTGNIIGFGPDGIPLPGFYVRPAGTFNQGNGTKVIVDLDYDGLPEVTAKAGDTLNVFTANGTQLPGFPVDLALRDNFLGTQIEAAGDVDGDGDTEIVGLTTEQTANGNVPWLILLDSTGVIDRKISVPTVPPSDTGGALFEALADLTGDGIPEIVFSFDVRDGFFQTYTKRLYAIDGQGNVVPGWPADLTGSANLIGSRNSHAKVGDVDGDGRPEIVLQAKGQLQVLNHDGTNVSGFPRPLPSWFSYTSVYYAPTPDPVIADIDGDGRAEIILTAEHWDGRSGYFKNVWVYDLGGSTSQGAVEWGQYGEGPRRQFYYETGKNLATQAYLTAHVRGAGTITAAGGGINCGTDCIERYNKGTAVTLTAASGGAGAFTRWLGACAGQGNPCTIALQKYAVVTAEFGGNFTLTTAISGAGLGTLSSSPAGIDCPTTCSALFSSGTVVTLTATPGPGAFLASWSGPCQTSGANCVVSIDAAKSVTANFALKPVLTVVKAGSGSGTVSSTPAGIDCGSDCSEAYLPNSTVSLTAVPAANSQFAGWIGPCAGNQALPMCVVTLDAARSVTATFTIKPVLTLTFNGGGLGRAVSDPPGVDCPTICSGYFDTNAVVQLTATSQPNSAFMGWSGACSGSALTCTVTMDTAKSVGLRFLPRVTLSVALAGAGSGRVSSVPAGIDCGTDCAEAYLASESLTLTAVARADSVFAAWSGACAGTAESCAVTMDQSRSVTATFVPKPLLTATVSGAGSVTSSPAGIDCGSDCSEAFPPGAAVSLSATAVAGNVFDGWTGACTGLGNPCAVTMDSAKNVAANFRAAPSPPPSGGGGALDWFSLSVLGGLILARRRREFAMLANRLRDGPA